jgi:hypothetical protein
VATRLTLRSSDGAAYTGNARLKSVVLTAGSDAATVTIDDSTDGNGTDLLTLKAAANATVSWTAGDPDGVFFTTGIYTDVSGTSPSVTVEYEVES